ncbi:hypothetical protein P0L94_01500 [Microbacter sp. GSS18]|nr:hypothetical protein P0L94_01500 [Microbacter sp. GSS18]
MTPRPEPAVALAWARVPTAAARREAAWRLVRELAGADAAIANPCPRCGGPHGPVVLAGDERRVSVAYSGDLAVAALAAPPVVALGIDAEPADRDVTGLGFGTGPATAATVRDWVRAEAVLKADGRGLRVDPAAVGVRVAGDGRMLARVGADGEEYRVLDLAGPDGHVVSAALLVR